MQGVTKYGWGVVAGVAFSWAAWGAGPPHCPEGYHGVHQHNEYSCVKNAGSSGSGSGSAEALAWDRLDNAKSRYNQANGAYGLSSQEAASEQRRLQSMDCLQFQCPTQEVQGRISAANASMSTQQSIMQQAIKDCNAAKGEIAAARAKAGAGHWYKQEAPTCPGGSGGSGSTTDTCPKGKRHYMGKCV